MRKIFTIVFIASLLLFSGCSSPEFINQELSEQVYGHYYKSQTDEDAHAVLILMGGSGYNAAYDDFAKDIAEHGYNVLLADYYKGGESWGGNGLDSDDDISGYHKNANEALKYLLSLSDVDKDNIAVIGFSYGGMLGLNLAYRYDEVDAVIDIYGYLDFDPALDVTETEFIKNLPPVCIIHGEKDKTVKIERAEAIVDLLEKEGMEYEFNILKDAGHAFVYAASEEDKILRDEALKITIDYLDNNLKKEN